MLFLTFYVPNRLFWGVGVGGGCTKSFTFTQYSVSKIFGRLYMAPIRDSKFCMRPDGRVGEINAPTGPNWELKLCWVDQLGPGMAKTQNCWQICFSYFEYWFWSLLHLYALQLADNWLGLSFDWAWQYCSKALQKIDKVNFHSLANNSHAWLFYFNRGTK